MSRERRLRADDPRTVQTFVRDEKGRITKIVERQTTLGEDLEDQAEAQWLADEIRRWARATVQDVREVFTMMQRDDPHPPRPVTDNDIVIPADFLHEDADADERRQLVVAVGGALTCAFDRDRALHADEWSRTGISTLTFTARLHDVSKAQALANVAAAQALAT